MFVRNPYNYDMSAASEESGLKCEDCSLAVQDQALEADINEIVRRFGVTGEIPQSLRVPTFQDFEDIFDFQSAHNAVIEARNSFNQLPAALRARFDNDPQQFVEFCSDPETLEERRKLGLSDPAPKAADPVSPEPAKPA